MQEIFENIIFKDETTKDKILDLIEKLPQGDEDINLDIADVESILESKTLIDVKIFHCMSIESLANEIASLSKVYELANEDAIIPITNELRR